MRRITFCLILTVLALLVPSAAVAAQVVIPTPGDEPGGFAKAVLGAVSSSNWKLLAVLLVVLVVWAARQWGGKWWPWLKTDRGGAITALVLATVTTIAGTLAAGGAVSGKMLLDAVVMAFTSAGGWALVKKLLSPSDQPVLTPAHTPPPTPK